MGRRYVCCAAPRVHLSAIADSGWLHTAPRYHQLMPISCHFQDCEALLFVLTTCTQRYIKYPGFTCFMERVILPLGSFRELLTDSGKEFENELCHELRRVIGIEKLRTTFYAPQCNGGIERWHSTMNSLLAKTVEVHQKDPGAGYAPGIHCRRPQRYRPPVYGIQPELFDIRQRTGCPGRRSFGESTRRQTFS